MELYHNSRLLTDRSPFGAVPVGTELYLCLHILNASPDAIFLRLWTGSETLLPMVREDETRWSVRFPAPEAPGLLWYYFRAELPQGSVFYGRNSGCGGTLSNEPESWQITIYEPQILPDWYKNVLAYQIFPDRFARGADWKINQENAAHPAGWKGTRRLVVQDWNDTPFYCRDAQGRVTRWPFFGGSLKGIEEKLPYLRSLGVGVLYLNPIFKASSNHKYDTGDYMTLDPGFGTEADFVSLCESAAAQGIRIILDGVFSHTGDDSLYFNRYGNYPGPGAFGRERSPYDSWYHFGEEYPAGYACWWGVDSLPNVEELDPGYMELICGENGVIRKWLRLGASGWRLDVADELPDAFIAAIRQACKTEKPDSLLLGEVWEDASHKISYGQLREYLLGRELDCTMHYPFRDSVVAFMLGQETSSQLAETLECIRENYPPSALYGAFNLLGTHDTPRILTVMGQAPEDLTEAQKECYRLPRDKRELALARLRLLQLLLFSSPGVPCIYYGDEAGMEGYADPFNRAPFPWGRENSDLQYHVRLLSHLRQEYPVLVTGSVRYLHPSDDVFGMERQNADSTVLIYVNRSCSSCTVAPEGDQKEWLDLLTGHTASGPALTLAPLSGVMLYREGSGTAFSPMPVLAETPKGTGVLCPVFSLPESNLGKSAYRFLEVLRRIGCKNWMLLPLCPAGDGNSPYSSRSTFAGDSRFISPDIPVPSDGFDAFFRENADWLEDYALYTVLRRENGNRPWQTWPAAQRNRTDLRGLKQVYADQLATVYREQYQFDYQWKLLKKRAKALDISLIGDLPIYAAVDSVDTWAHPELFQLDENGYPTLRAGCPPDYFTPEGQDWGNPLYDWNRMQQDGYSWWVRRMQQALSRFDYVRLDHFRGFAAYYAIPAGSSAKNGFWMNGPGISLFRTLGKQLGRLPILAEDLGILDSQVALLLQHTGLSGMNVWQFTPQEIADMAPEAAAHRVFFSGTHDNQTLKGFLQDSGDSRTPEQIMQQLIRLPASAVIFPVQDLLELDDTARINIPGVPTGNWVWHMTPAQLTALGEIDLLK